MLNIPDHEKQNSQFNFLSGGAELGELIRAFDWTQTPLQGVTHWPQSLRSAVSICLNSNFPIAIYWGPDLHLLYNDAWKTIPGDKHPNALGMAARDVWPEIWDDIQPQFAKAFTGRPGGSKDALLPMRRRGYTEECYFDFTFTPIYGEQGTVEGVFNAVIETSYRVISERRTALLKNLPIKLAQLTSSQAAYKAAITYLTDFPQDLPFCALYTIDRYGQPKFVESTSRDYPLDDAWLKPIPVSHLVSSGTCIPLSNLDSYLSVVPDGYWPEKAVEGVLVPIKDGRGTTNGFLFCVLSSRLRYDEEYRIFLESIAGAITTVTQNIEALETERKRSDELFQLDKAKTAFFTNISHEFRTPLTLLLGPVEQLLDDPLTGKHAQPQLQAVYRNAVRLQKLVNSLLEFSRIEAGRAEARHVQVDIGALTEDIASSFRSAIETAGLTLHIQKPERPIPVRLDPDMWEKIILNLISNAFKYTLEGRIDIEIKQVNERVIVSVSDTGCGIPSEHIGRLFDRFHRVDGAVGRSQEGTGIGLALVKELVRLHDGDIWATSEVGVGSTFHISIPANTIATQEYLHTPIPGTSGPVNAYSLEAQAWNDRKNPAEAPTVTDSGRDSDNTERQRVLVADDNGDMRSYIERLLSDKFAVITAENGRKALEMLSDFKPDLIISDIMMPDMNGFTFLQKLKSHPELKSTPVIFLSARAGDEAKIEGLDAGADDYLVKPFSAKELIVRVNNLIRINKIRRETEEQFYQLFLQAPAIINVFRGHDHVYEIFHPRNKAIFGDVDFTGKKLSDAIPEMERQGILQMLDQVFETGVTIAKQEMPVAFVNSKGEEDIHYFNLTYQPWYDLRGNIQGVINFAIDVTAQVLAQQAIEKSERNLRSIITHAPVPMCIFRGDEFVVETVNNQMLRLWGKAKDDVLGKPVFDGLPELQGQGFEEILANVNETGLPYIAFEKAVVLDRNGKLEEAYVNLVYDVLKDSQESVTGIMAVAIEVTDQVLARRRIEDAEEKARLAIESADLGTYELDLRTSSIKTSPRFNEIWGIEGGVSRQQIAERIHPEDLQQRQLAHASAQETGSLEYEARIVRADQSLHWVRVKGKVIHSSNGDPVTLLGVVQDITEQKHFSEQLHLQVQQRTLELQRSNEDLQQFAHVTSHDLKEPVRKIKLFSGRLQTEYAHALPEKALGFLAKIQQSTERMFAMIDGVLLYSSLNASQDQPQRIDLNEIMTGIESDLEILIKQKNGFLHVGKLPVIEGLPVLIYQLFYNLINNSLKFSRSDLPAIISVEWMDSSPDSSVAWITVTDNGIGFNQLYAQRIFEPFARLNAKDDYEGTGLGLSLCRKIVERHHGHIGVESAENAGTKFVIALPYKQR